MAEKNSFTTLEKIRNELNEATITAKANEFKDYWDIEIILDNLNLKSYQRNRTARGGHSYDPLNVYKNELLKYIKKELDKVFKSGPLDGDCEFHIIRYLKYDYKFSKKKIKEIEEKGIKPKKKPDNDNIEKLLWDVFNGVIYQDDGQINYNSTRKYYLDHHKTIINIKIWKER